MGGEGRKGEGRGWEGREGERMGGEGKGWEGERRESWCAVVFKMTKKYTNIAHFQLCTWISWGVVSYIMPLPEGKVYYTRLQLQCVMEAR